MNWTPKFLVEREVPVERDPGVIDLNESTVGDREAVASIRKWRDAKEAKRQDELRRERELQAALYGDDGPEAA